MSDRVPTKSVVPHACQAELYEFTLYERDCNGIDDDVRLLEAIVAWRKEHPQPRNHIGAITLVYEGEGELMARVFQEGRET